MPVVLVEQSTLYVEPQYTTEEKTAIDVAVPDVVGLDITIAKKKIDDMGLKYTIVGGGEQVTAQMPSFGSSVNAGSVVVLYTDGTEPGSTVTVPDVTGKTLSQVRSILTAQGLNLSIVGAGATGEDSDRTVAEKQKPAAGSAMERGGVVEVEFRFLDVEGTVE